VEQTVARHKTIQKDGYAALVVQVQGTAKKPKLKEIRIDEPALAAYAAGSILDATMLADVGAVRVTGISKGK